MKVEFERVVERDGAVSYIISTDDWGMLERVLNRVEKKFGSSTALHIRRDGDWWVGYREYGYDVNKEHVEKFVEQMREAKEEIETSEKLVFYI